MAHFLGYFSEWYDDQAIEQMEDAGDARRCPAHPYVVTSSRDRMYDGLCGECEAAMERAGDVALEGWEDFSGFVPSADDPSTSDVPF